MLSAPTITLEVLRVPLFTTYSLVRYFEDAMTFIYQSDYFN